MSRLTRVPALSFETGSAGRKDTTYRGPDEALTMTNEVQHCLQARPTEALHRSSSSCFSTSAIIWPTDWIALMSSSVFSKSFSKSFNEKRTDNTMSRLFHRLVSSAYNSSMPGYFAHVAAFSVLRWFIQADTDVEVNHGPLGSL